MNQPWKVIFVFIGVFCAGAVFGVGGLLAVRDDVRENWLAKQQPPRKDRAWPPALMRRFTERLDLTADQRVILAPIVERAGEDFRRARETSIREANVIFERLQSDISKVLTAEQRVKLDQLTQEHRERVRREREAGGERRGDQANPRPPRNERMKEGPRDQPSPPPPEQP